MSCKYGNTTINDILNLDSEPPRSPGGPTLNGSNLEVGKTLVSITHNCQGSEKQVWQK